MIKDIISNGPYMNVGGGGSFTPYINMHNASAGMVRWNGTTSSFEIYDGSIWQVMSTSVASVGLNSDAISAITWAKQKMDDEAMLEKLAKEHPAINFALENLKKAKRQLDATILLSKEHDESTS